MTTETSNACGEWPARYACNGPEGTFWTDDATLANKLIAATFDRDEWTITDTQNPTAAAPQLPSAPEPDVHSYDPTDQRQSVTIRWPDGKCLSYVLDRTRYTDNLPQQSAVVDDAMVERACRHWYTTLWDTADQATKRLWAKTMYDLLTAALSTQQQPAEEGERDWLAEAMDTLAEWRFDALFGGKEGI